jgi:glycerate 2-kinase
VRVVVAPDSFGGTLSARDAAAAIAEGWRRARPDDEVVTVPMSDGGEGLLDVLARPVDVRHEVEVAGPLGRPVTAAWLERTDGSAVVESALACGLALVPAEQRTPLDTTTFGVGQLLDDVRRAGCRDVRVGLGGSATVDGGAGALTGLGYRLTVADGSGLKVGGLDLHRVAHLERGWAAAWDDVEVTLLADVTTVLDDAAVRFGPQKGATPEDVEVLRTGLARWAEVVERDLDVPGLRSAAGSGAAGGLGFGLAAGLGGRLTNGAVAVAELVGLHAALADADVVITGEGRLDATSLEGKVVDAVTTLALLSGRSATILAVCGRVDDRPAVLADVEASAPRGPGEDPHAEVAAAAARLAERSAPAG